MFINRDKCEYAYRYTALDPEMLYADEPVDYGMFESNATKYWDEVYRLMSENKSK